MKKFSFKEELSEIRSKTYSVRHLKYPLFLLDVNENRTFSTDFSKNTPISNFVKIRQVEAESFHTDGQTHKQTDGRTDRQADRQI